MKYMFDTNIFNALLDGRVELNNIQCDGDFMVTQMQINEIKNTSNISRREELLGVVEQVNPERIPTSTSLFGITEFGSGCFGDGVLFERILEELNLANNAKKNNYVDALIAETTILNGATLLTADNDLANVMVKFGGYVDFRPYY